MKEKIAASRRAREERAARRAARKSGPALQKALEADQATPPAAAPADLWAVSFGDDDDRELTEAQIAAEASRGTVHRDTLVWREGMEGWQPLGRVPELVRLLPREQTSDTGEATPVQASGTPAPVAMPPPLARTALGVGPVSLPEPAAAPIPAPPLFVAPGGDPSALAPQQAAPNPFLDNPLLNAPVVQAAPAVQSPAAISPVARPAQPVSLDLEMLPPVKKGRPVLWIAAIVAVVALALVIGVMTSWFSPPVAVPTAATSSSSATAAVPSPSVATVRESTRPAQPTTGSSTTPGRRDPFFSGSSAPTSGSKPDAKRGSTRKPDFSDVFADKLQGKGPKR